MSRLISLDSLQWYTYKYREQGKGYRVQGTGYRYLVRDQRVSLILERSTHLQTGYLGTHTKCLIGKFRYKLIRDLFKFLGVAVRFSIINHFLLEAEKEIRRKLSSFELHYRKLHKNI